MADRVYIFDTTLRDGEQSPGCSMTVPEKLRMAAKLVELGVDILEAGFPIASQGDFEAVDAVSREFPWVQVAALARCQPAGRRARRRVARKKPAAAHSHLHRHQRHSSEVQAEEIAAAGSGRSRGRGELAAQYVDDVEFSAEDGARTDPDYLEEISRAVVAAGRAHGQHSGYRRLFGAR
jgi:2-isopropylmalate synthase